jgi:predicted lipoprotein
MTSKPVAAALVLLLSVPLGAFGQATRSDLKTAVRGVADSVIVPDIEAFATASEALAAATRNFCQAPGPQGLAAAQTAWRETASSWNRVAVYRFGPLVQGFPATLDWRIDSYLMDARPKAVRKAIRIAMLDESPLDAAYLEQLPVFGRGVPALEHLLFESTKGDRSGAAIVSDYDPGSEPGRRRCAFLMLIAEDLEAMARTLRADWAAGDTPFVEVLASAGSGEPPYPSVQDAVDELVNRAISAGELIKLRKVDAVLHEGGDASRPYKAESPLAEQSLANIRANLDGIAALILSPPERYGLDDYLRETGQDNVAKLVAERLEAVDAAIAAMDLPLHVAVQKRPEEVRALSAELARLNAALGIDLADALNVALEFNESDGD